MVELVKGALGGVKRQPLHDAQIPAKRHSAGVELARERHPTHQTIVRIEGDAKLELTKFLNRVFT